MKSTPFFMWGTDPFLSFRGRMRRRVYWTRLLLLSILFGIPLIVYVATHPNIDPRNIVLISTVISLPLALISLSMEVRRLHDIGNGGMLVWVAFGVGMFNFLQLVLSDDAAGISAGVKHTLDTVLFILCCFDSAKKTNKWGPSPKYGDNLASGLLDAGAEHCEQGFAVELPKQRLEPRKDDEEPSMREVTTQAQLAEEESGVKVRQVNGDFFEVELEVREKVETKSPSREETREVGIADEEKEKSGHWEGKNVVPICLWLLLGGGIAASSYFYFKGHAVQRETQRTESWIATARANIQRLETQDEGAEQGLGDTMKEEKEKSEKLEKDVEEQKEKIQEMERKIKDIDKELEGLQ